MTTKIAPTLRRAHPRPLSPREVMQGAKREIVTYRADDAHRELRALIAVARAADHVRQIHAIESSPNECNCRLCRALARLARVSGGRRKR